MPPLARATVAGAMRTTATMVTTAMTAAMAATMTPNGDKDNKDGICRRQQRRDIIHMSKSAGKCNRQLISQGGRGLLNSRGSRADPARGVPGNAAGSGTVEAAAVSIAGGGAAPAPRSWRRLCWGHKLMALWAGCLAHGTSRTSFPLCWGGCRHHRPSQYRERWRAWWMVGAGGGEVVALRITGVQK